MNQFALLSGPGGTLIADYSHKVQGLTVATGPRGFAEASGFIPMSLGQAFLLYDRAGLPHVVFSDNAAGVLYEGRLEDVNIVSEGIKVKAFGYARAMSDVPYTALWSVSDFDAWVDLTDTDITGTTPEKYAMDRRGRLYMALQKGNTYTNNLDYGIIGYRVPHNSSRLIVGAYLEIRWRLPTNWQLIISRRDDTWGSGVTIETLNGGGGIATIVRCYTFTGSGAFTFLIQNNTGGNHTEAVETGTNFVEVRAARLVTSTANSIDVTTTATWTAGSNVTISVTSTARMYAGQRLQIDYAGTSEAITVASVTNSTQFVAASVATTTGATGFHVRSHVIYADEIAKDLISVTNTLNSTQLVSSTAFVQSPAVDLFDEVYEDRYTDSIMDYLVGLGDNQTPPRQWEWGVLEGRALYFRPQSSASRSWYIDLSDIDIDRTLDQLHNSTYALYKEASGRTLRTAASSNSDSVTRYGITRRQAINVDTTSATQAGVQRDASLADTKDPKPRSAIALTRVYDATGARWPLAYVRAGDTVIIRNIPPTLSTTIDRIRSFRLNRAEYHADDDTLRVEPAIPRPTLEILLARLAIGLKP